MGKVLGHLSPNGSVIWCCQQQETIGAQALVEPIDGFFGPVEMLDDVHAHDQVVILATEVMVLDIAEDAFVEMVGPVEDDAMLGTAMTVGVDDGVDVSGLRFG